MNSSDIKRRAVELSKKTNSETIPPQEVGGIMYDTVSYMEDVQRNSGSLGIRKTYTSVSAMEADKNPKDSEGNPLKKGMLVNIYNPANASDPDNNKVYAYNAPGWVLTSKLDAGYATKAEINELNISNLYPTNGEGGTNKYTLAGAIAQVPAEYRNIQGLKITFINNETGKTETWVYNGNGQNFTYTPVWNFMSSDSSEVDVFDSFMTEEIPYKTGKLISLNDGTEIKYGTAFFTDYINLDDKIIIAYNIGLIPYNYAQVAFYDEDGVFIPEYDRFFMLNGGGSIKTAPNVILTKAKYPRAKTCRFSGGNASNLRIRQCSIRNIVNSVDDILSYLRYDVSDKIGLYSSQITSRYLKTDGTVSNWSGNILYKIDKALLPDTIIFSAIKPVTSSIMIGGFKGDNVLVQTILSTNSLDIIENYILLKDSLYEEVEYILVSSKTDTIPTASSYNLNTIVSELFDLNETRILDLKNLIASLSVDVEYTLTNGYIGSDGTVKQWGGTKVMKELLPFDNKYYFINKMKATTADIYVVAFYDESNTFIPEYDDFRFKPGGSTIEVGDIYLEYNKYPLAKKIKISGIFSYDTVIKSTNYQDLNARVDTLEDSIKNADFSVGQDIYGVGDSIASQILGALVTNIGEIDGHKIVNGCRGGESTLDTLARENVFPYVVLPFTIPATTTQSEAITFYSSRWLQTNIDDNGDLTYLNAYRVGSDGLQENSFGEGVNPWNNIKCTIGGIKGTLYFIRYSPNREYNYFIRDEEGEEVVFDRPQLVIPTELQSKQCIWIDFMGTNNGWVPIDYRNEYKDCADILVNYYEQLQKHFNHDNYLFLGYYGTAYIYSAPGEMTTLNERWKYFEDKMVEKFGKHYFSVRQYLREYGWRDAGYQLGYRLVDNPEGGEGAKKYTCLPEDIEADKQAIRKGRIPYCIVNGPTGVHMLAKPSACVANQVIKRLYELGCINSIPQIDISTIKDAENADINEPDYGS